MQERLTLSIRNDLDELPAAIAKARAFLQEQGGNERVCYATELVLEEILTNIIKYAWDDAIPHTIAIMVSLNGEQTMLHFEDDGRAFDPTVQPESAAPTSIAEAEVGGLGLKMVRKQVAGMEYERRDGRWNRLRVRVE